MEGCTRSSTEITVASITEGSGNPQSKYPDLIFYELQVISPEPEVWVIWVSHGLPVVPVDHCACEDTCSRSRTPAQRRSTEPPDASPGSTPVPGENTVQRRLSTNLWVDFVYRGKGILVSFSRSGFQGVTAPASVPVLDLRTGIQVLSPVYRSVRDATRRRLLGKISDRVE